MRPIVRYRGHSSVCSASYVPPTSSVAHLRHTQPWTHSEIDQQACWKGDRVSRTGDRVGDMVLSIVVLGWTCVAALAPCSERALKRVHINVLQQHHGRLQAVAVYLLGLCCARNTQDTRSMQKREEISEKGGCGAAQRQFKRAGAQTDHERCRAARHQAAEILPSHRSSLPLTARAAVQGCC